MSIEAKGKVLLKNLYRFDDKVLQRGDTKKGRASVFGASDRINGNRVIIKQWRRGINASDRDLHEIWRQELRQLHRLAGYPGARKYIVPLIDSGDDEEGFFLVLDSGQKSPLQVIIDEAPGHHWLKQPRLVQNRLVIWNNLLRVASGLNLLHMQGLLHRNIDTWAIYSSGDDDADFQLTGFEWSIRLSSNLRNAALSNSGIEGTNYVHSFLLDWQAFGALISTIFNLDTKAVLNKKIAIGLNVTNFLSGLERDLLLQLLRADPFSRIDGETVKSKISNILKSLETSITKKDDHLYFSPKLGSNSDLSKSIRASSNQVISLNNIAAQIEFIENDLSEDPQFVFSTTYGGAGAKKYSLFGRRLNYRLTPYRHFVGGKPSEPTWGIASCDSAADKRPIASDITGYKAIKSSNIKVMPYSELTRKFSTLQGRTVRWDQQLDIDKNSESEEDLRQYRALLLVQILESLLIASEIWPVQIHSYFDVDGKNQIELRYRKDEEREKLAKALGLRPFSTRMIEEFKNEKWKKEEEWKLTDIGVLGEHDIEKSDWTFLETKQTDTHGTVFLFEGSGMKPVGDKLFLRASSFEGTDKLLNRRANILLALRDHSELLNSLRDPIGMARSTHEIPTDDEDFKKLDSSKQAALIKILAVVPLFMLQGPPGVGKTRLVRELVRRRLSEDSSARILLSAQSHDAVDHLLHEIDKDLSSLEHKPIVIRSKAKDDKRETTKFDLPVQAQLLAERISGSDLVQRLPQKLKAKINALIPLSSASKADDSSNKSLVRSLESLLLRGANLVFSSTNSRDLEQLIEERAQFDWSIVEEAGKAIGPELLAPLLLSHRRLMIGDHKQLPPFGADVLKSLLSNPQGIRDALTIGESIVSRVFREGGLEEIVEDSANIEKFTSVCGEASGALLLFESLVTGNLQRYDNEDDLAVSQQLEFQHRMHPAIAKLVSDSFYNGVLLTHHDCIANFAHNSVGYTITDCDCLPSSPIVFIDMPFVQSTMGKLEIEKKPRYHNPEEVDVVIKVLSLLRAKNTDNPPSIAVLTPYSEQVRRLKTRILQEKQLSLAHVWDFSFESENDTPVGTVDSFQGNEADIVIVSLVRNNARSGMRGLGFLSDPRRMNVLLSRARSKLIIIGSHEFLTSRFLPNQEVNHEFDFLKKVLNSLEEQKATSFIEGIPDVYFVKPEKICGVQK